MNKFEMMEAARKQRAFDIMDRQMGEQRIIDEVSEKLENRFMPLERRVNRLEHWRTALSGGFTAVLTYMGLTK